MAYSRVQLKRFLELEPLDWAQALSLSLADFEPDLDF